MQDLFDLSNKDYVVIGAASGIGYACANMIAGLGGRVACLGSDAGRLAFVASNLDGSGHRMYACDSDDASSVCRAAELAAAEMGPIAGAVYADMTDLLRLPPDAEAETVERLMRKDHGSFVSLVKALCTEGRHQQGHLSVVALSFLAGTSRGAAAAVRELAGTYASRGVRLNAVTVSCDGPMPLGRIEPRDVAALAAFLLSSVSGKISGAIVPITAGGGML